MTFAQIASLGPVALVAVVAIVAATLGIGILLARRIGFDAAFGALARGAVARCSPWR